MNLLDDGTRNCYAGLADVLVPAQSGMPSATEAGVPSTHIERALSFRPDLVDAFVEALSLVAHVEPVHGIDLLAAKHPEEFAALTLLTTGAYYLSEDVRSKLLLASGQPKPVHEDLDEYVDLLEKVVERGQLFRPTTAV